MFKAFKVNSVLCVPPDAFERHECRADRPVGPGALPRHQLCRHGDQSSEEQSEERKQGRVSTNANYFPLITPFPV